MLQLDKRSLQEMDEDMVLTETSFTLVDLSSIRYLYEGIGTRDQS
jgi:hypothetical protein